MGARSTPTSATAPEPRPPSGTSQPNSIPSSAIATVRAVPDDIDEEQAASRALNSSALVTKRTPASRCSGGVSGNRCEQRVSRRREPGRHPLPDRAEAHGVDEAIAGEIVRGHLIATSDAIDVEVGLAATRHLGPMLGHGPQHREHAVRRDAMECVTRTGFS